MAYQRVPDRIWSRQWDDDTRLLALYLMTCPHRLTEGLFRMPKGYILADLQWPPERLAEPFTKLLREQFIDYDDEAEVLLLREALIDQQPENPNQVKAAMKRLDTIPQTRLFSDFLQLAEQYAERLVEPLREQLPKRLPKPLSPSLTPTQKIAASAAREGDSGADPDSPLKQVEQAYCQLTGRLMATTKDIDAMLKALEAADVPTVLAVMEKRASEYVPSYEGDQIRAFAYFLPAILQESARQKAMKGGVTSGKGQRNAKEPDPDLAQYDAVIERGGSQLGA